MTRTMDQDVPAAVAMREPLPPASLVIPSRQRPRLLLETVTSVLAGEEVPAEIVIIDQSDAPNEALASFTSERACQVVYQWNPGSGASRARNQAIRAVRHDLIVFLDDDMRVAPTWYGTLMRALLDAGPRAVATGSVLPEDERASGFVPSIMADRHPAVYEGRIGEDILYLGNMVLRRSAFDEVGILDERLGGGTRFPSAEDNDLAFRLLEAGYRIHYVPEAEVYHRAWRSDDHYLPLRWSYGRGQGAFYAKHAHLRDRYMLWRLAQEIRARTTRCLRVLPSDPRRAAGQVVSLLGVLTGFAEWLFTRRNKPV
jgi:GT2 family glycosyltransferase